MRTLEYKVSFNTPAFLGNAEQSGQWRTPPFKALLRQWWRVVKAPMLEHPFNVDELRAAENILFGAASDDGETKSHRSLVRLRLLHWDDGKLSQWPGNEPSEFHPEVGEQGRRVGTDLYLGFGPLEYDRNSRSTQLSASKSSGNKRTAIDEKAKAALRLMFPCEYGSDIQTAMQLAAWFGTLGSRSRNGWGALHMEHDYLKPLTQENLEDLNVTRLLDDCLREEWPHAVGKDDRPLVWKTNATGDWRAVMRDLARIKIAFRTQQALSLDGVLPGQFAKRHLLAYPVTSHPVNGAAWGDQGRLANQIRFKLAKAANGQLEGVIVHLPCALPNEMAASLGQAVNYEAQFRTWQAVHAILDKQARRLA